MQHLAIVTCLLAVSGPALAQTNPAAAAPDKSAFTLCNPTPRELWRPMSADRPDVTESPKTVDAGAVQREDEPRRIGARGGRYGVVLHAAVHCADESSDVPFVRSLPAQRNGGLVDKAPPPNQLEADLA